MIRRKGLEDRIARTLGWSRVVALLGPRQCGKTTIARKIVKPDSPNYFDLEDPRDLRRLENPMEALSPLRGVVVIDEVQRRPELYPILRVLADRETVPAKFLVLGSSSPALLRQTSESLAGRIARVLMSGFSVEEVGLDHLQRRWLRGGFPRSYLANDDQESVRWRREFVQTFLERDVPQFGVSIPSNTLGRFWSMAAHSHGQIWNGAQLAQSLGMSQSSIRRYLDLLSDLFMIRQLPPWHANIKKRQVKSPKMYFRDSGLLHQLLGIHSEKQLYTHPKYGASWEGLVVEEILRGTTSGEAYFWATHQRAEIDLVLVRDSGMYGVECKRDDAPGLTPSIRIALEDLALERVAVVYPGSKRYAIADRVEAVPVAEALTGMDNLFA